MGKITPIAVSAENHQVSNEIKKVTLGDIVTDPFGFPKQLSVSLCLLPVLRGRSGSNVHETGFATTSNERM